MTEYSKDGAIVLDPFLGSGTTIMAAHQNERHGLGIEILEKYVAVTLERFYQATGIEPVKLE
jgi:site-specific DNA-methyltransferase (adenine-specific)